MTDPWAAAEATLDQAVEDGTITGWGLIVDMGSQFMLYAYSVKVGQFLHSNGLYDEDRAVAAGLAATYAGLFTGGPK